MHRPMTLLVLACALFLRVWVPVGWMPAPTGGAFAIEPCAAAAPTPMSHASHHGSSHKNQHDGDCSFAPHHTGAAQATSTPALAQLVAERIALPEHFAAPTLATGPPAPPPPATGPPAAV